MFTTLCLHEDNGGRRGAFNGRFSHGHLIGGESSTYRSWLAMVQRCTNPARGNFSSYGGRGITVCERWMTFGDFLADMGPRPDGMTLDRINNDGNYEHGNCRWATKSEQAINRRHSQLARPPRRDLTGLRFGTLVAVSYLRSDKSRKSIWLCQCDCGKTKEVIGTRLTRDLVKTCGACHE